MKLSNDECAMSATFIADRKLNPAGKCFSFLCGQAFKSLKNEERSLCCR